MHFLSVADLPGVDEADLHAGMWPHFRVGVSRV